MADEPIEIIEIYPGQENELYTCISSSARAPRYLVERVEQRVWHMVDMPWRVRLDLWADLRKIAESLPMKFPPMRMVTPVKFSWRGIPNKI